MDDLAGHVAHGTQWRVMIQQDPDTGETRLYASIQLTFVAFRAPPLFSVNPST
jgi:hypothetical protein